MGNIEGVIKGVAIGKNEICEKKAEPLESKEKITFFLKGKKGNKIQVPIELVQLLIEKRIDLLFLIGKSVKYTTHKFNTEHGSNTSYELSIKNKSGYFNLEYQYTDGTDECAKISAITSDEGY